MFNDVPITVRSTYAMDDSARHRLPGRLALTVRRPPGAPPPPPPPPPTPRAVACIARHVIGCHFTQYTRVTNACR